jgi:hypothetical protein
MPYFDGLFLPTDIMSPSPGICQEPYAIFTPQRLLLFLYLPSAPESNQANIIMLSPMPHTLLQQTREPYGRATFHTLNRAAISPLFRHVIIRASICEELLFCCVIIIFFFFFFPRGYYVALLSFSPLRN